MRFWIDVENSAGTVQGDGPITSAAYWRSVRPLDRAGKFAFEMPATDSRTSLVTARRVARCYAVIDGAVTEVGAGIIDVISPRINADGRPMLVVSGPDLLGELRRPTMDDHDGGIFPAFDEVDDAPYDIIHTYVNDKLSSAWDLADEAGSSISSGAAVTNEDIYATFRHDSALNALIAIAQAAKEHFRIGSGRTVEWVNTWNASGFRAVYGAVSPVAVEGRSEIAQIVQIEKIEDSQDIVNRVFLYGTGEADTRLNLLAADTWPDGTAFSGTSPYSRTIGGVLYYVATDTSTGALDTTFNMLQDNASVTTYGPCEMALAFKNIAPLSNTAADVTAAANQLLRAGFNWLSQRSNPQEFYRLRLAGVQGVLKPGTTIPVYARRYVDGTEVINLDETLNILEATVEVGVDGLRTTELVVSTAERYPTDDSTVVAERMAEAVVSQAHQQTGPNSWNEHSVAVMDDANYAAHYTWLGEDIAQVQQILLRFRVEPLRSTVRSVAGSSTGSGAASTSNSGSSAPGGNTGSASGSGTTGPNLSGGDLHSHNFSLPGHTHPSTTDTHQHTIDHTHTFTPGVTATYGLFVESSGNTYGHSGGAATVAQIQNDIDILVGGSDRSASISIETSDSNWFQLDVTEWLVDATTKRPAAASNSIVFQKAAGAAGSKSARITFLLQVRCTIQSIKYS